MFLYRSTEEVKLVAHPVGKVAHALAMRECWLCSAIAHVLRHLDILHQRGVSAIRLIKSLPMPLGVF